MTREEAATILYKEWQRFLEDNLDYAGISDAYKMAINTLKQEPCEDCISRQEVIDLIADYEFYELNMGQVAKGIRDLPSITPQPKIGHWQKISADKYSEHVAYYFRCSECGKDIIGEHNYCPNCGSRMKGVSRWKKKCIPFTLKQIE